MGGGGKGGSQTTTVELPPELEAGAIGVLGNALRAAALPYAPNQGVTVAAFSPQQQAAFQGSNQAAMAYGLPSAQGSYMPAPQTGPGGVMGYSTGPMYQANIDASMSPREQRARDAILRQYAVVGNEVSPISGKGQNNPTAPTGGGSGSTGGSTGGSGSDSGRGRNNYGFDGAIGNDD